MFKKLFLPILLFSLISFPEEKKDISYIGLTWEKDFELILELNNVPTRGEILKQKEIESLEKELKELLLEKEYLNERLSKLDKPILSSELYEEMLKEDTRDISSTKEKIREKLNKVEERISEIKTSLKKLKTK